MTIDVAAFDRIFNPKSVAVIGDKAKLDFHWLKSMSTFNGPVYSVQVDEREIPAIKALGVPNYTSLMDIPEPVDFVVVSVPRKIAPQILDDCIEKKVGGAAFFTSGFAETATEEGITLQKVLAEKASEANFMLVGPNCMGLFVPKMGLRCDPRQSTGEGGTVAFIGQSGTHTISFSLMGAVHGVKVSKAVSFGNAVVLDSPDYLEYMAQDSETSIICMYVEGFRSGRRFFETLREVAKKKPVVVWKGGETTDGARAVASHTASLATEQSVWNALIKQTGAISVHSMEEMIDVTKALLYIKPPTGSRSGIIALTGGQSVVSADAYASADLEVTALSDSSYEELSTFFTPIGTSYKNPLDVSSDHPSLDVIERILNILERDERVEVVMIELPSSLPNNPDIKDASYVDSLLDLLIKHLEQSCKPFYATIMPFDREVEALQLRDMLKAKDIPSFPSFQRGANAYKKILDHYRLKDSATAGPVQLSDR